MKLSVLISVIGSVKCQGPSGCYWAGNKSGEFVECLPDFYIKGACESDMWWYTEYSKRDYIASIITTLYDLEMTVILTLVLLVQMLHSVSNAAQVIEHLILLIKQNVYG